MSQATIENRTLDCPVKLRRPHSHQQAIIDSQAKRKIIRAGRRSGKTVGIAILSVLAFLDKLRVLYAAPTIEQVDRYWFEVSRSLGAGIDAGALYCNQTEHVIEVPRTENRIKAKTAWNANTMRGDYADLLIYDEWQLMSEDAWEEVGAPMLLDNNGNAIFIYTPPSLRSAGISKARDPRHAAKMFKRALEDPYGRWAAWHFTSHDNPHISREALGELFQDMSAQSYRQEIMAEDDELQRTQLVYGKFNEDTQKVPRRELPTEWPRYVGHDFGGANPAALFMAQDQGTGFFWIEQVYLPGPGRSISDHVEHFKRMTEGLTVVRRVGGSPQEDEIRQGYAAFGWPIQAPKWGKVAFQVDRVIGMMERNQLYVFNDLYQLLEELMNCLWERDQHGDITNKIENEQRYHLLACLRYIGSEFMPENIARDEEGVGWSWN